MVKLLLSSILLFSFHIYGQSFIKTAHINSSLEEVSGIESVQNSKYLWVLEDAGNSNEIIAITKNGGIVKKVKIENVSNDDWEDLTSDNSGNLYIGDFGNNSEKRQNFYIYKILNSDLKNETAIAKIIKFRFEDSKKTFDLESFFIFQNHFYLFSKKQDETTMYKVPNELGEHKAKKITTFEFEGKNNKVTSADISPDKTKIALLNHDKVWILSDFKSDNFFGGRIEKIDLYNDTQKEGILFISNSTLIICDERDDNEGGNLYRLQLK